MSKYRKLGCDAKHRRSLLKGQVTSLLRKGSLITTVAKAKELRRMVDKVIALAKRGERVGYLHVKRMLLGIVRCETTVTELLVKINTIYQSRVSGYSTMVSLGNRRGDNAMMCIVKLIDFA